jgi:hypothetical protein
MKKLPVLSMIMSALGAAGGYAYYYFIGCASGTCPLSSNAWIMTGYGAMMGATLSPFASRNKQKPISEVRDDGDGSAT